MAQDSENNLKRFILRSRLSKKRKTSDRFQSIRERTVFCSHFLISVSRYAYSYLRANHRLRPETSWFLQTVPSLVFQLTVILRHVKYTILNTMNCLLVRKLIVDRPGLKKLVSLFDTLGRKRKSPSNSLCSIRRWGRVVDV